MTDIMIYYAWLTHFSILICAIFLVTAWILEKKMKKYEWTLPIVIISFLLTIGGAIGNIIMWLFTHHISITIK